VEVLEELVQLLKLVPILTTEEEGRLGAGQPTNDPAAFAAARAQWLGEVEGRLGGLRQMVGELRRSDAAMAEGEWLPWMCGLGRVVKRWLAGWVAGCVCVGGWEHQWVGCTDGWVGGWAVHLLQRLLLVFGTTPALFLPLTGNQKRVCDGMLPSCASLSPPAPHCFPGVQQLLTLLAAGSQQPATSAAALQVMAGVAGNWVELLAGLLLWKFPTVQPHLHLKGLVQKAASEQLAAGSNEEFLALLAQVRKT
jgi:hypothetical protein